MDKIIVPFEDIRGLGDIVNPKSLSDFQEYLSVISSDTEEVNGILTTVYTMDYSGSIFLLQVSKSIVSTGGTITITVTLIDEDGNPIENADIDLYKVVEE